MKHAPLRGLRCFPRESTGSMSGKCGWVFDMANLPERSDVTRPVCADTALAASVRLIRRPGRGVPRGSRGEVPVAGSPYARRRAGDDVATALIDRLVHQTNVVAVASAIPSTHRDERSAVEEETSMAES